MPEALPGVESVYRLAMLDHFRKSADLGAVYSVPRNLVEVASLERASAADPGSRAQVQKDTSQMFFRLVTLKHLPAQKTVSKHGLEHLHWHDLAITLHNAVQVGEASENTQVYTEPITDTKQPHNPISVLSFRHVHRQELESTFLQWQTAGQQGHPTTTSPCFLHTPQPG